MTLRCTKSARARENRGKVANSDNIEWQEGGGEDKIRGGDVGKRRGQ